MVTPYLHETPLEQKTSTLLLFVHFLTYKTWSFVSLAWPDRFFSHGAYRLEIISACSKKGLVIDSILLKRPGLETEFAR